LDDFYQPLGLDSLTPSSGSPRECEPDSISLATDELLALPADGSQPFLPPIPLNPRIPRRESLKSSSCPSQTSGLPLGRGFNPHRNPPKALSKKKHTGRAGPLEEDSKAFPWGNYPRWLNQSDLSVSGISSIPSSPYPAWLKTYNLFSDPAPSPAPGPTSQREASSSPLLKPGPSDPDNSQFSNPSGSLEPGGDEREGRCHPDTPHGCFSLETSSWAHTKQLWREPQLLPVPTTERPSEDGARTEKDGSPATTEILQAGRPWPEAPGALKPSTCWEDLEPPLALPKVDLLPKSLEDRWSGQEKEAAFSGGHQPRPLEALKLLLFQLQAIQGSLSQWATTEQKEEGGK
ncbi:PREDICTED: lung adenoma susceptibility protein 2, partial [Nestor notabilis]|uniref:lung adenoma susceptibility protein 2 n=1 Tax=Nestor notabilis TaxID=176057 RepID=UPI0005236254